MSQPKPLPVISERAAERFRSKVQVAGDDDCWRWSGSTFKQGYGRVRLGQHVFKAHRIAYYIATGHDPLPLMVCHTCDNPMCCNPSHLFLGTKGDNNRDRELKGRGIQHKGEKHGQARLTESDVRVIRRSRRSLSWLAKRYGVSPSHVCQIRKRTMWQHVS